MHRANISAPDKLIGVAAREAKNLPDFRHGKQMLRNGDLMILDRLLIGRRQTGGGQSSEHRGATGNQDASHLLRYLCSARGILRDLVEARNGFEATYGSG